MNTYTLDEISERPKRLVRQGSKASLYPFDSMIVNTGFIIPAGLDKEHRHCRCAASNYNRAYHTNIRCNKTDDGSLQVWMDEGSKHSSEPKVHPTEIQHPTKFEFVAWLNSLAHNTAIYIPEAYADRYNEFANWINEMNEATGSSSAAAIDNKRLKITKG